MLLDMNIKLTGSEDKNDIKELTEVHLQWKKRMA